MYFSMPNNLIVSKLLPRANGFFPLATRDVWVETVRTCRRLDTRRTPLFRQLGCLQQSSFIIVLILVLFLSAFPGEQHEKQRREEEEDEDPVRNPFNRQ
jgi:hypothetical protein